MYKTRSDSFGNIKTSNCNCVKYHTLLSLQILDVFDVFVIFLVISVNLVQNTFEN